MAAEVGCDGEAVAADSESEKNQPGERERLGHSEDVLHQRAELHTEDIHGGQGNDNGDSGQIRGADADLHIAKHHRSHIDGRHMRDVPQPMRAGDSWKEDAEKFAEGHANRGYGSGLDDKKQRPSVEKAPQRTQRFAQVDILAAGFGHHGGQLTVAERANHGHDRGDGPCCEIQRRRIGQAGNVAVDDKDAAADHRAHNDGGGAE